MKKILLITCCLMFALCGCGKKEQNVQPTNTPKIEFTQKEQETIKELELKVIEEINTSYLDSGHFIVRKNVDLSTDTASLTQYAYIKDDNLEFLNKEYIVNHLYATDKDDNFYEYFFYDNTEELSIVDYITGTYIAEHQNNPTLELKSQIYTIEKEIDGLPLMFQEYYFGNDVEDYYVYSCIILLDNTPDNEVYFVCKYITKQPTPLSYDGLFKTFFQNINLQYNT